MRSSYKAAVLITLLSALGFLVGAERQSHAQGHRPPPSVQHPGDGGIFTPDASVGQDAPVVAQR